MISVAQHHVGNVAVGIVIIERFVISRLPFVESLVEDQQTECVAHGEELRRRRIMRAADCIATYAFQSLQSAEPHLVRHCHSKTARILMQAHALEFHVLAVEPEPGISVKADIPESEPGLHLINYLASLLGSRHKAVHCRTLRAPGLRSLQHKALPGKSPHSLLPVIYRMRKRKSTGSLQHSVHFRFHKDASVALCLHKYPVLLDMLIAPCHYPHVAVYPRPGVPSRLFLPVNMHHDPVLTLYI